MQSRGLTISGSGTVSTRTSWVPCQVRARMGVLLARAPCSASLGLAVLRGGDLAGLQQHLQPLEVMPDLDLRLAPEELRDQPAERAARGDVLDHRRDLGAAVAGPVAAPDQAAPPDPRALDRPPPHAPGPTTLGDSWAEGWVGKQGVR